MPTIRVPDALRRYTGGAASFPVAGGTLAEALADAFRLHPDLRIRLVDETGRIHRHLVVFRNDEELPRDGAEAATLAPDDGLTFLEAIGGGARTAGGRRMPRRIGAGVIGAGFAGRIHARSVGLAGGRLVGIVGSSPERSEALAGELGAARAFPSAEELIADPEVEVVHVCTPNHRHGELAEAALQAGKHVVCEKPLAVDSPTAERLASRARSSGLVATVPFVYRYYPVVREARARVRAGDLGVVRLVHGTYLQDWLMGMGDYNWRVDPRLGGPSRAFADIGSHWCDLMEFVTGQRITRLCARLTTVLPERLGAPGRIAFSPGGETGPKVEVATEDVALVLFETDGGAVGSVVVSQVSPGRKNRLWFEIDGSQRSVAFDQEQPETIWIGGREESTIVARGASGLGGSGGSFGLLPAGHPGGYLECFDAFVADTYRAIRGEPPEGMPVFADGLRAVRVTESVLDSARTSTWCAVEP